MPKLACHVHGEFMKVRKHFLTSALILSVVLCLGACSKVNLNGGNAEGFGGGDALTGLVKTAGIQVTNALTQIQSGTNTGALCKIPTDMPNLDKRIQRILSSLTPAQISYCRSFITTNAGKLLAIIQQNPPIAMNISLDPLQVIFPNGQLQSVDAMTPFGPSGDIKISAQSIQLLSGPELNLVVAHEFSHKIYVSAISGYVTDNDPIGPYTVGRDLLDNVGAGIALYYSISQIAVQGGGSPSGPINGVGTIVVPIPGH